jgi:hypothetical protein
VYWLVLFSIVVHGLSIPVHNLVYKAMGVKPIVDARGPTEKWWLSISEPAPKNSTVSLKRRGSIVVHNPFSAVDLSDGVIDPVRDLELGLTLNREPMIQFEEPSSRAWTSEESILSCSDSERRI